MTIDAEFGFAAAVRDVAFIVLEFNDRFTEFARFGTHKTVRLMRSMIFLTEFTLTVLAYDFGVCLFFMFVLF